ncbi:hypothetical protein J2Y86_000779 [Pseudomonas migulae]|uniref:hypothetical protein n=1 Tax=Pseudomonas migulae TaxID=78543 RepID=UPI00209FABB4|nr:hypothetical protein [Pseudomonas migulae]
MGKFHNSIFSFLLIALGSSLCSVQADDGIIIIKRDVQVRNAMQAPVVPDPNPTTVNANPSKLILTQTNELNDGDFANVASGAGITRLVNLNNTNLGGNITTQNQISNPSAGRGSSGNGISNLVNSSVQRGLSGLNVITGGR